MHVVEAATACVGFATKSVGVEPDFTRETLPIIDHYLEQARPAARERPETLPLLAQTVGAYLGEVIRREHRCWWRADAVDPAEWRLEFGDVWLAFYPVEAVRCALAGPVAEDDGTVAGRAPETEDGSFEMHQDDGETVRARLAELPAVSEQEYFAPSTRLEVIDIAVDAMMGAQLAATPEQQDAFGPDDYEE